MKIFYIRIFSNEIIHDDQWLAWLIYAMILMINLILVIKSTFDSKYKQQQSNISSKNLQTILHVVLCILFSRSNIHQIVSIFFCFEMFLIDQSHLMFCALTQFFNFVLMKISQFVRIIRIIARSSNFIRSQKLIKFLKINNNVFFL